MAKCTEEFIAKCNSKYGANAHTYYDSEKEDCMCGIRKTEKKGKITIEKKYSPKRPTLVNGEVKMIRREID